MPWRESGIKKASEFARQAHGTQKRQSCSTLLMPHALGVLMKDKRRENPGGALCVSE